MSALRLKMSLEEALQRGTDFQLSSRFQQTLTHNALQKEDASYLKEIYEKLTNDRENMVNLFTESFNEMTPKGSLGVSNQQVEKYLNVFFTQERSDQYFDHTLRFF